jgi:hypothetical protein
MADPRRIGTRAEWSRELKALFTAAGLSYAQLSERCGGVSTSTLQKMVTGQSFPRPSTVRLFTKACGERDAQPWVDARARVAAGDPAASRPRTPSGRQVRVGAVPRASGSFQVRETAAGLREASELDGTGVLTQVLAGMGGVGKSQLAAAHARWAWHEGAGMVMWVNAASRNAVVAAYADAAHALTLPGSDRDDPERSAQAFLIWAETVTSCWWLVVLDDVQQPGDLNGLWPPAAESAASGQVLVTTRLREAALSGTGRRTVEISVFTPREARAYLRAQLGGKASGEDADALAGALGMLPLALAQASAYIRNEDITVGRYLDLLATRLLNEVVPEPGHLTDDHQRAVVATWELSVDQADKVRPAGLARPLLQLTSLMDPAGIPQQVLSSSHATAYLSSASDNPELGAVDEAMVDEALRVLHRYSLINHDRASAYREVSVHQLVQRATRENFAVSQQGLGPLTVLAFAAADALHAVWPEVEHDELGQVLRANVTALQQVAGPALRKRDEGAHCVLSLSASSLGKTGQAAAACDAFANLYRKALHHLGPDHPDTLAARHDLALWRGEAGDAAGAVAAIEELLADQLRVLGPDHPDTLAARHDLANWRGTAGNAGGAAAELAKVLADYLRVLGPDHPSTLAARGNLARWQAEAGDPAGAVTATEELLADYLQILGPGHPDTLATRHNRARWRGELGDAVGGVAALEELLADYLRVLGANAPGTLVVRSTLARCRAAAGDPAGAVAAFEELVADRLRVLGAGHARTLDARRDLARWRGELGDAAGAAAVTEELLADQLRILEPDHPDTLASRHNLARWRAEAGDTAGVAAATEGLLADLVRVLGPDHPDTLASRHNLAHWQGEAGDAAGAVAALEKLLPDCLRILGARHPGTLTVYSNLDYWRKRSGSSCLYSLQLSELVLNFGLWHLADRAGRGTQGVFRGYGGVFSHRILRSLVDLDVRRSLIDLQQYPKPVPGLGQLRFHRAYRDPENLRRFLRRVALEQAQSDDFRLAAR